MDVQPMAEFAQFAEKPGAFPEGVQKHKKHHGRPDYPDSMTEITGGAKSPVGLKLRPRLIAGDIKGESTYYKVDDKSKRDDIESFNYFRENRMFARGVFHNVYITLIL